MNISDALRLFSLDAGASEDDIRAAYKQLAIKWHPDKNPGQNTNDQFKNISDAYYILREDRRRLRPQGTYDEDDQDNFCYDNCQVIFAFGASASMPKEFQDIFNGPKFERMVVEHAEYTRQCVAAAMREQAKKDAEKRARRPEAIQAASVQHDLLQLLERARQIQPEPFKVTNSIRCAQNKIKMMLADDGNDDALSIFLANIQVIQLQTDLEQEEEMARQKEEEAVAMDRQQAKEFALLKRQQVEQEAELQRQRLATEEEWKHVLIAQQEQEKLDKQQKEKTRQARQQDARTAQLVKKQHKKSVEKGKKTSVIELKKLALAEKTREKERQEQLECERKKQEEINVQKRAVKQLQKDVELDQAAPTPQPEVGLIISRNVPVTPCSTPCFYDKSCQPTLVISPRPPLPAMSMLLTNHLGNGVDYKSLSPGAASFDWQQERGANSMGWCEGEVAMTLPEAVVCHPIFDGVRCPVQSAAEQKVQNEQQRLHHHYVSGFMLHHHDLATIFLKQMEQLSVSMDRQTPLFVQQQHQQLELMRARVSIEKQLQYQLQYVETYIQHQEVMQQPCMPTHELLKFQFQQEQAKMRHFMLQQSQNMEQYLLQQQHMYQVQLQGEYAMAPQHKAFKKKPTKKTKAQKRAEAAARVQKVQPTTNVEDLEVAAVLPESCHSKLQPQMKPAAYKKVQKQHRQQQQQQHMLAQAAGSPGFSISASSAFTSLTIDSSY